MVWGARSKCLCFRLGRELHYENPEAKTSKHLLVWKDIQLAGLGPRGEREIRGGDQRRSCQPQFMQGLECQTVTCTVSSGGDCGRDMRHFRKLTPCCVEWPGSRGTTRIVQL